MEPCEFLEKEKGWKWVLGLPLYETVGPYTFSRNYFDCAKYYFDGEFNIAQFDRKIYLYHGSAVLAKNVVAYPVGADFYKPVNPFSKESKQVLEWLVAEVKKEKNWHKTIDDLLTEKINISSAWFADPGTAALYSGRNYGSSMKLDCKEKCIFAYETKFPITVFVLDDPYNIAKLLNGPSSIVPDNVKKALMDMFSIKDPVPIRLPSSSPMFRFYYPDIIRKSIIETDKIFNKWFCKNLSKRYDGYGASTQPLFETRKFHLEFAFCNPIDKLKRSYRNEKDWQYIDYKKIPHNITLLLDEFTKYETTNVNFHSGNLIQHSIWTMLYSEYISKQIEQKFPGMNRQAISFIALLHDIGKVNPNDPGIIRNLTRKKFIYSAQPEHPRIGAIYVQEDKIPKVDPMTLQIDGYISMPGLFQEAGIEDYENIKNIVSFIIDMHWYFGDMVLRHITQENIGLKGIQETYVRVRNAYVDKVVESMEFYNLDMNLFYYVIHALMIVSLADVFASQVFPSEAEGVVKNDTENTVSEFFPYLGNMSKVYRGSDIPKKLRKDDLGIKTVTQILSDIKEGLANGTKMHIN